MSFAVRDLQGHASSWWGWGGRDWVNLDESLREWFWVYIYIHIHIYSICQLYTCIQTCMHASIHIHMHMQMHIHIHIHIHMHMHIHIHPHTYTYIYIYILYIIYIICMIYMIYMIYMILIIYIIYMIYMIYMIYVVAQSLGMSYPFHPFTCVHMAQEIVRCRLAVFCGN